MKYALSKDQITRSTSFKRNNIILYVLFSFIILNIAIFTLPKSTTVFNYTTTFANAQNISNNQSVQNFTFVFPWFIIIVLLAIILTYLGMFTKSNPKTLADILTSQNFKIEFIQNDDNIEVGLIKLPLVVLEITWNHTTGQFYTWTLFLKLILHDSAKLSDFDLFSKLLLLEKDEAEDLTYKKVFFARDWPRQEYLLNYWLQGLTV